MHTNAQHEQLEEQDSRVSLRLSNLGKLDEFIVVEFPGNVIDSPDRALQCIGGERAVSNLSLTHTNPNNKEEEEENDVGGIYSPNVVDSEEFKKTQLRCQFGGRVDVAENSHALFSETRCLPQVLVKVVRKRKGTREFVEAEVLGKVPFKVTFPGFADYCYISKEEHVAERLDVIPPRFNPFDYPCDYKFQPGEWERIDAKKQKWLAGGLNRYRVNIPVAWDVEHVPQGPNEGFASLETTQNHPMTLKLKEMFEKRPIWYKYTLIHEFAEIAKDLGYEKRAVIKFLPAVAYRFYSGAWRMLYIRFGYDPRINPQARFYQLIDLRLSADIANSLGIKSIDTTLVDLPYREMVAIHHLKSSSSRRHTLLRDVKGYSRKANSEAQTNFIPSIPVHHARLTLGQLQFIEPPSRAVSYYQLCDLQGNDIQSVISESPPTYQCSKGYGWFTKAQLDEIRLIMKTRIQLWISKEVIRITPPQVPLQERESNEEKKQLSSQFPDSLEMFGKRREAEDELMHDFPLLNNSGAFLDEQPGAFDEMIDSDGSYDEYQIFED